MFCNLSQVSIIFESILYSANYFYLYLSLTDILERPNSLPNDQIEMNINMGKMIMLVLDRIENTGGEQEKILVTSIFSCSYNVFNPFPIDKF